MTNRHSLNHPNDDPEFYYFIRDKFKAAFGGRWLNPSTANKLNLHLQHNGSPDYWCTPSEASKLDIDCSYSSLFITPLTSVKSESDSKDTLELDKETT